MKVKEDQGRARGGCVYSLTLQESQSGIAVLNDTDVIMGAGSFKGFNHQADVPRVIVHNEQLSFAFTSHIIVNGKPCVACCHGASFSCEGTTCDKHSKKCTGSKKTEI
jgi:hypothetical protein